MIKLKVTTVGNSMGVIFPKELVEREDWNVLRKLAT